nr:hypothetical protein [Tanacetum cinerariifolium]
CLENPPYKLDWKDIKVPVSEGSPITTIARIQETYKNVSQEIRDQLNAEAEAVQVILTGIDNDIYSTVDACPNACEMLKVIERLKQGESINVQDLETNLYWEFGKFTSRDGESLESYYLRNAGYENQRNGNVAGARENVEQADWRDDTDDDDELEDQELEAHYMYMAQLQEVSPDAANSGPIFDDEPLQKVSNDDHYHVFALESVHPEQSKPVHDTYPIEQDAKNVIIDSLDMSYDREEIDQNDDDNDLSKEHEWQSAPASDEDGNPARANVKQALGRELVGCWELMGKVVGVVWRWWSGLESRRRGVNVLAGNKVIGVNSGYYLNGEDKVFELISSLVPVVY